MGSRIISEVVDHPNEEQTDSQTSVSNQPEASRNAFDLSIVENSLNESVDSSPVELSLEADALDLSEEVGKTNLNESEKDVYTIYRFTNDVNAASKDPLIFGKNLFIPARFIKGQIAKEDTVFLVISPEYARKNLGQKADKIMAFLEEKSVKCPNSWTGYHRKTVIEGAKFAVKMRIETRSQFIRIKDELAKLKQLEQKTIQKPEKKRKRAKELLQLDDEIVVKSSTLEVKLKHAMSLRPGEQVYDSVLDYFLLKEFQDMKGYPGMIVLEHWVWISICYTRKVRPEQEEKVYGHIKKLNGNDGDFTKITHLVLPVLVQGHWLLVLICNPFPTGALIVEALGLDGDVNAKSAHLYQSWIDGNRKGPKILLLDSMYEFCMDLKKYDMSAFYADFVNYVKGGIKIIHQVYFRHAGINLEPDLAYVEQVQFKTLDLRGLNDTDRKNDCAIYCIRYLHTSILLLRTYGGDNVQLEDADEFWYALFLAEEKITRKSLLNQIYKIAQQQKCPKLAYDKIRLTLQNWQYNVSKSSKRRRQHYTY